MAAITARSAKKSVSYHDLYNLSTADLLFDEKKKKRRPANKSFGAYVCHITDIFIIIELSQKLFDIEFLYKYCKVIPPHQPIKVVLKTAVRSIEYS